MSVEFSNYRSYPIHERAINIRQLSLVPGLIVLLISSFVSGFLWWGEAPSTLATVICSLCICCLALVLIHKAHRIGVITEPNYWLSAFGLRILAATILVGVFWYQPDLFHRSGYYMSFDPVRWDALGEKLAADGIFGADKDTLRYGKNGLLYYIAVIYKIFGVSCIYVAWMNALIALSSLILMSYWLHKSFGHFRRWDALAFGLFIPEGLWFGSLALKEVHIGFFISLGAVSLFELYLVKAKKSQVKWGLLYLTALFGLLVFQRAHVITLFIFSLLSLLLLSKRKQMFSRFKMITFILMIYIGVIWIESIVVQNQYEIAFENAYALEAITKGSGAEKFYVGGKSINSLLIPNNLYERIAFSIPRTIFYTVTPFPRLEIWSYWSHLDLWVAMNKTSSRTSVLLFLLLMPAFVASIDKAFRHPGFYNVRYIALCYAVSLFVMANGVMMFHERWRSSLWQFWLVIVLLGWPYRRKYFWTIPVCSLFGFGSFFMLKVFL